MVEENLHIRRAAVTDAALISRLSEVTFFETFKGTCTDEDMQGFIEHYFNKKLVCEELQDSDDFYFIAFVDDIAAGYIRMKEEQSNVEVIKKKNGIELKRIYVMKEHHLKKIGAALMNFALDFATNKGYELLWLGVWEHNERAIKFYKKFGFEDTGFQHPFPIGNTPQTDNWMIKTLGSKL